MTFGDQPPRRDWAETLWVTLAPVLARVTLGLIVAVAAMWCFVELAEGVTAEVTHQFDAGVLRFLYQQRAPLLFQTMTWISWVANGVPQTTLVFAVLAGLLVRKRPWPDVLTLLLAVGGGLAGSG